MNNHNNTGLATKICLVVVALVTMFIVFSDIKTIKQCNNTTARNQITINSDRKKLRSLNTNSVTKSLIANKPNLNTVKKYSKIRAYKAFKVACTQLHSKKQVKEHQGMIKAYLGNSCGQSLIDNTKPIMSPQGKVVQQSNKLKGIKVGFGKYNSSNNSVPMNVLVEYQTSPYINGSGDIKGMKPEVKTYFDAFHFKVITKNSYDIQFKLINNVRSENNHDY